MLIWILLAFAAAIVGFVLATVRKNRQIKVIRILHELEIRITEGDWFHAGWEEGRDFEQREQERKKLIGKLI